MKVIFGTTNPRKLEDLDFIVNKYNLDLEILTLTDIGWNLGEIEETGATLEENSLIKAKSIFKFCQEKGINYPIITDDAGLFVDSLNQEPGIYTARYADEELKLDPSLPKHECVNKLLRNLAGKSRRAKYRCVVTCMDSLGKYTQEIGESYGTIATSISLPLVKPYFYSVFILDGHNKTFNLISKEELEETYRYKALKLTLRKF